MIELIPSLLVQSEKEFEHKLRLVEPHVKTVHVDILDGSLFDRTSWHDVEKIGDIETPVRYEIHLMVENPLPYVEAWKKHVKNTFRAIIQSELDRPVGLILEEIRQTFGLETGLTLNPESPIKDITQHLPNLDEILVMGIHPGASGQPFLGQPILEEIKRIKANTALPISCDGGVTLENAETIVRAGCNRLVTASAIFAAVDPQGTLLAFQKRLSEIR
ncbi:MAG: hypothetical protein AAB865_00235 [Patescibacteria group bacterium]